MPLGKGCEIMKPDKKRIRSVMIFRSRKGFTLVELMVVIALIGILAAALVTVAGRVGPAGKAVRCKNNLRNLAQAALSYAVANEGGYNRLPWAGSYEHLSVEVDNDRRRMAYRHRVGWVSCTWSGGSPWPQRSGEAPAERWFNWDTSQGGTLVSGRAQFHGDRTSAFFSLTNGTLWKYVGKSVDAYVCDVHKTACKGRASGEFIARSYVMNASFGMDFRNGKTTAEDRSKPLEGMSQNADKLLMFAELPAFTLSGGRFVEGPEVRAGQYSDGVLDTRIKGYRNDSSSQEIIGFNNMVAGRPVAHVAFSDGHVGVIAASESPGKKPADDKLKALTCLLCNGADIPAKSDDWTGAVTEYFR